MLFSLILTLFYCCVALAAAVPYPAWLSSKVSFNQTLWQPDNPSAWLECITERPNGDLLVTRFDNGEVWSINPHTQVVELVYKFNVTLTGVNSTLGIDEYEKDVFAVIGGQIGPNSEPIVGTWGVWSLDLRQWTAGSHATPSVELLAAVPESGFLNGLSVLYPNTLAVTPGKRVSKPTVLFADTIAGQIYALDIGTNNVRVFYSNPEILAAPKNLTFPVGLNGVQVPRVPKPSHVYFTASHYGTFYRIELEHGAAVVKRGAKPQLLLNGYENLDDFSIGPDGSAYLATSRTNEVLKYSKGTLEVIATGDIVATATGTWITRKLGRNILYVVTGTTDDGQGGTVAGKLVELLLK